MIEKDQTRCPNCGWLYCPGFWKEGVCLNDMHFSGEPTSDGDEEARCLRVWYEAHRETWWERSTWNMKGRHWEWAADNLMLGMLTEMDRIHAERKRQLSSTILPTKPITVPIPKVWMI